MVVIRSRKKDEDEDALLAFEAGVSYVREDGMKQLWQEREEETAEAPGAPGAAVSE